MGFVVLGVFAIGASGLRATAAEPGETPRFDPQHIEFFEKRVRPLLAERCYKCHSSKAKSIKGRLRLDSRAAVLAGGDTGPAVVPGQAAKSLLIDAVRYGDLYQMPPDSRLPKDEVAILEKWVSLGAPWPEESGSPAVTQAGEFDLEARRESHWCWQPIRDPELPPVKDARWPRTSIDRFILSRLEAADLRPASPAEKQTLLRRIHFDLVGLPPSPAEVDAFLADDSQDAFDRVVDRLLASPAFGERWARHWLDLVRYAESRGHEFDADAPNAFQYRDYVIRALNADVPYDQFVREHFAGDLQEPPRLNPAEGFNESVIGTGFWFLGEWVHSPVSIRQDECDRFDNMIDVASKTFLGVTVACARCHEHKFDAISQEDYYALAGYLQSSSYRLARFDSMEQNRKIASEIAELRREHAPKLAAAFVAAASDVVERLDEYLLASSEAAGTLPADESRAEDRIVEDFEGGAFVDWQVEGDAFGDGPMTQVTIPKYQGNVGAEGRFFVNSHRGDDGRVGRLLSASFRVQRRYLKMLVGGGAHKGKTCVNLLVEGKPVATVTGRNDNRMHPHWWDLSMYKGRQARLEIVDQHRGGWGHIGVDHIVQTDAPPPGEARAELSPAQQRHVLQLASQLGLDGAVLCRWVEHWRSIEETDGPLQLWARLARRDSPPEPDEVRALCEAFARDQSSGTNPASEADKEIVFDFAAASSADWMPDGPSFGPGPVRVGGLLLSGKHGLAGVATYGGARRDPVFENLQLAPTAENDFGRLGSWVRSGRTIRTPSFTIEDGNVYYLASGTGHVYAAVDSHRLNNGPLHGKLIGSWKDVEHPRWHRLDLRRYAGHRVHLEFSAPESGPMTILKVAQGAAPKNPPAANANRLLAARLVQADAGSLPALALQYRQLFAKALVQLGAGSLEAVKPSSRPRENASLADWMIRHRELLIRPEGKSTAAWGAAKSAYAEKLNQWTGRIEHKSRLCMAMLDGSGENEYLLIRGNYKTPAERVPRRLLTALSGKPASGPGSGRLELAEQIAAPDNPLTSRVMVNRVWHHLFGRGLVPSVDNFGVLGEEPSHPELLDHLATRFVEDGWSIKRLIRRIVLSRTYRMSGTASREADRIDPTNRLLHKMPLRRMQGEVLRDWILAVSGRLDRSMYGPSVPVHLTPFMQGRGRPGKQGPLDGDGRRSIYIAVRRNFLSPMMLAFDTPIPFTTMGRRNVSNVPAQALILMNDPFVVEQAQVWAARVLAEDASPRRCIERMYLQAFGRPPGEQEIAAARDFLGEQARHYQVPEERLENDPRVWADLGHVLWNAKEFQYVP